MTPTDTKQMDDSTPPTRAPSKATRPDEQNVSNKGKGVDKNGLPNDPVATAQDKEGANADKTQG